MSFRYYDSLDDVYIYLRSMGVCKSFILNPGFSYKYTPMGYQINEDFVKGHIIRQRVKRENLKRRQNIPPGKLKTTPGTIRHRVALLIRLGVRDCDIKRMGIKPSTVGSVRYLMREAGERV